MIILFDLDNTLINRDKAYVNWLFTWIASQEIHLTTREKESIIQYDNHGYTSRKKFYEWLILTLKLRTSVQKLMQEASTHIYEFVPVISSGINTLLLELQKQHTLGIVTNGSVKNQMKKIQSAHLTMFSPEHIFVSEAIGIAKPELKYFIYVENQLKASKEDIVIVGDNLNTDIIGGKAAGWKTIWLTSSKDVHPPEADEIITDLTAIKNIY